MKVLLTHGYFLAEDRKEQQIMRPYPPLGILYISAYLEEQGIDNDVYDTTFSTVSHFSEYVLDQKPDYIGIYVNLMTKLNVLQLMQYIKTHIPNSVIILGGPEVRYSAQNFLEHGADYIVMGEGEETMLNLLTAVENKKQVSDIQGIAFLEDGAYIQTEEREKIRELDQLPVPNRKKINLHLYLDAWKKHHGKNALSVSTMRGCPYTCKWCSRAVYGLSYRRRSPEKVADELLEIKNTYHPDSVWFVDDVFTISHKWLREFSEMLKTKGAVIPFECITRADRMNEEVIQLLKEAGCFRVWIGAESGSQKVIDLMDRRVDVKQVREMIIRTKAAGIEAGTFIMLGYPGETEADIEETIHHLTESNPDYFTITVAYPIKGTELYQEVEALQTTDLKWENSNDRQIDFKRTYSRKYYDYAVGWVTNETNYSKARNTGGILSLARFKTKSIFSRLGMRWVRTFD